MPWPVKPQHPENYRAIADFRSALCRFNSATEVVARTHGLTTRRYELLALIEGSEAQSATVSELAARMYLELQTVTELAARAEAAGLVNRSTDALDRRVTRVSVTPEGKRRLASTAAALAPERARLTGMLADIYRRGRAL